MRSGEFEFLIMAARKVLAKEKRILFVPHCHCVTVLLLIGKKLKVLLFQLANKGNELCIIST